MATASTNIPADYRRRGLGSAIYDSIADVGAVTIRWVETLGDMTLFMWRTLSWLITRLPRRDTLVPAFYNIGVLSLPVIALTGTFIGMVLAVQSYTQFKQFGFETRLGALINLSMCRELGPVLAATMLAGRVGSAIAAEVGTMRVTEQIDALATKAKRLSEERQREIVAALQEMLDEPYRLSADELAVLQPALAEVRSGRHLTDAMTDEVLAKPWS